MQPVFSVIIPTRNRFAQLAACLEALAAQDYPRDKFEVIVVNDASISAVPPPITQFGERVALTIVSHAQSTGPGIARNHGAESASGEFLAFTDDDCVPAPDWLSRLGDRFESMPNVLIGGRVINALTTNPYSTAAHVILDVVYRYYDPSKGRPHFFPTSNFAVPAKSFRQIGGFDETWPLAAAEDRELCYRWMAGGWELAHDPAAVVYHRHPLNFASFCSLHFRYGRGAYHYHLLRGGGKGEGGLKPDWGFYWNCFRYPWQQFGAGRALAVSGILVLWQVFNAAGYFSQRRKWSRTLPAAS
jgi:glycosyltransferase involved in cell wall biosynthesis